MGNATTGRNNQPDAFNFRPIYQEDAKRGENIASLLESRGQMIMDAAVVGQDVTEVKGQGHTDASVNHQSQGHNDLQGKVAGHNANDCNNNTGAVSGVAAGVKRVWSWQFPNFTDPMVSE